MSVFTMINRSTKEIGEEKEFKDYIEARKYCAENYGEGWESKYDPFHFNSDVYKFLKTGNHSDIKFDDRGHVNAIINDGVVNHCGFITLGEHQEMRSHGIKMKSISKREFIELHNALIESV